VRHLHRRHQRLWSLPSCSTRHLLPPPPTAFLFRESCVPPEPPSLDVACPDGPPPEEEEEEGLSTGTGWSCSSLLSSRSSSLEELSIAAAASRCFSASVIWSWRPLSHASCTLMPLRCATKLKAS
jgi:hypothetical protein